VRDELVRILTEGGARRGFELLDASGMLADLLPEVAAMKGVGQPPEFHPEGDVWRHTLLLLEARPPHADAGAGARCCTTWASRPRSAWRSASASTATWRRA
jgi:tRNA nucleotidyltransferase/poly(A) polymerase